MGNPIPPIGTSARDILEQCSIDIGDQALAKHEDFAQALVEVRRSARVAGWDEDAQRELGDHVEQVWIGRVLR